MSHGETDDAATYVRLRRLITSEPDVAEVLGLSYLEEESRWIYLIRTVFASWPRYAIGTTDAENLAPEVCFECGTEWAAMDEWQSLNLGNHP